MIALTLGDPAGIGPEIVLAAWARLGGAVPFVVLGDADVLAARGAPRGIPVARVDTASAAEGCAAALPVIHRPCAVPAVAGAPDPANAPATIGWIEEAVALAKAGAVRGLCTAPISKAVLQEAGFPHPGHTEFLGALTGTARPVMMLAAPALRVVPVTIHIPLADVPGALTQEVLEATLRVTEEGLRTRLAIPQPRIAVAGLNPHAGESGRIGREEIEAIAPVLERLRGEGMAVTGPHPADTLFHEAARARYDVAVCMYHDQALVPLKALDFARGVNVTLGLPFLRTSPDHGTAFDIAGQGRADPTSLIEALRFVHRHG